MGACCYGRGPVTVSVVRDCGLKGIVGYWVRRVRGFLALLVSQSDHRIDFHRPPRGNVASGERDEEEDGGDDDER